MFNWKLLTYWLNKTHSGILGTGDQAKALQREGVTLGNKLQKALSKS